MNKSFVYVNANNEAINKFTRTQNICLRFVGMSSAVESKFPVKLNSIATQKTNDKTASRGPALNSLPQGAGKCPIAKLKLKLCPEFERE